MFQHVCKTGLEPSVFSSRKYFSLRC